MTLHQILLILRARWVVVAAIFAAVFGSILALSLILPKQYTATASVVVDAKIDPVAGTSSPAELLPSYITTQVDIIGSKRVAQHVVSTVKLDRAPDFVQMWRDDTDGRGDVTAWVADFLIKKKLAVIPGRESNVIDISVKWPDAKFAAVLANAFAQWAIETNIELKVEPAKQYAQWFDERSKVLRADLEAKQRRLSDYQNSTGMIVATDDRLDIETTRLNELSTQLVAIQGERQDSQSRQRQAGAEIESLPEVLQSPVIASLKADLSTAEAKRQDILTRLGKNHPDYQTAAAEIENLRDRISLESSKIASSLGGTNQVNMRREAEVRIALDAQKKRVLELKHQHDEAAILQSDVLTSQRNLDAVTQRLAQSDLESQTQQTNIVLLAAAQEPVDPSSPRILRNSLIGILMGLVLGVVCALLLELRNRKIRDDNELRQLLGVPLLAKIGSAVPRPTDAAMIEPVITRAQPTTSLI